jgi:hypothetical protein
MPPFQKLARVLGVISAGVCLILWAYLALTLWADPGQPDAVRNAVIMGLLALMGIFATLFERPFLMLVIFLFSFFPVGLYMLGVPSIFFLIGVSNLLYLAAAVALLYLRYLARKQP